MDNPINIAPDTAAQNWLLPLADFYEALRGNGFSITVTQIAQANRIIVQYANQVKNSNELHDYLAPVFVSNAEEQQTFQELFNQFFKKEIPKATVQPKRSPKNWKWLIALYAGLALAIFTGILLYQRYLKRPPTAKDIVLKWVDMRQPKAKLNNTVPLQIQTGQLLQLKCGIDSALSNKQRLANKAIWVNTEYHWGTGANSDTIGSYRYEWPGKYTIRATARVWYNAKLVTMQEFEQVVVVCDEQNSLRIIKNWSSDFVAVNTKLLLRAITDPALRGANIEWYVDGDMLTYQGETFETAFKTAGEHVITCKANFGGKTSFCMLTERIVLNVRDNKLNTDKDTVGPAATDTTNAVGASTPVVTQQYNPILKQLYYTTLVLFALLGIFFFILWERERKNALRIKQDVLNSYNQVTAPPVSDSATVQKPLPYQNKNHLGLLEPELREIALQMRKRIGDTASFLDTEKTIRKSIEMAGFFQPVYSARTKQSEYLFLVQEKNPNSQMAKLINYLTDALAKQNVLIEKYYYQHDMGQCYHPLLPNGIGLEKLAEKYANHTLLIFSDGAELLSTTTSVIDEMYWPILDRWEQKALVTPVSYADWGVQEKEGLFPLLPVFPMDLPGLQLLFELLNNQSQEHDAMARLRASREQFYPSAGLALDDSKVLEQYCKGADWANQYERGRPVNVLFQWVAALAVCPKIEWEVILAIGKAILSRYGLPKELNFSNLLRLARIGWINEGVCPDALRLALLQQLKPENEVIARATMLELLQEIPQSELADDPTLLEEKEIQRITHEFSLYVHNPGYYASYRESSYLFEKLWREGKIKDGALVTYYKNEAGAWQNLLSQADTQGGNTKPVGIEEYFESEHQEASIMTKVYLYLCIISIAGAVFSYFSLLLLRIWEG